MMKGYLSYKYLGIFRDKCIPVGRLRSTDIQYLSESCFPGKGCRLIRSDFIHFRKHIE